MRFVIGKQPLKTNYSLPYKYVNTYLPLCLAYLFEQIRRQDSNLTWGNPLFRLINLPFELYQVVPSIGQVAQLVEQRTENPRVGGSIPSLATISSGLIDVPRSLKRNSQLPTNQELIRNSHDLIGEVGRRWFHDFEKRLRHLSELTAIIPASGIYNKSKGYDYLKRL